MNIMKLELRKALIEEMLLKCDAPLQRVVLIRALSKLARRIAELDGEEHPTFVWAVDQNLSARYS